MSPASLVDAYVRHGCTRLLGKRLSPNDNSKNQIYLGGDYSALNILPFGRLIEDRSEIASSKRVRLKAMLSLYWLDANGDSEPAPNANLILYPKYPEVRLSGMLQGVRNRVPSSVIAPRGEGRWLFLGIASNGHIIAYPASAEDSSAKWAESLTQAPSIGVFREFPLAARDPSQKIREELRRIADLGWIRSKRLDRTGAVVGCESRNCGGYTLEAELGIIPNGRADPDFDGWEVKQFNVGDLLRPVGSRITLFTPEPDGGLYVDAGVQAFVEKYGYADMGGIANRINFGGTHEIGTPHEKTKLTLVLSAWNDRAKKIESMEGGIQLLDASANVAAAWSYSSLINHWKRKHAKAVYVPSVKADDARQYKYGHQVLAATGTDFPLVLESMMRGHVFYDPGIKMENANSRPAIKRRSQFRIRFKHIGELYHHTEWWNLSRT